MPLLRNGAFQGPQPGDIKDWPATSGEGNNPGWLTCNDQAVSRETYSDLFDVIGTTYGVGDGSTTFNIPDFRGRAALGDGTGTATGATAHTVAQTKGFETHTITLNQLALHHHSHQMSSQAGVKTRGRQGDNFGTDVPTQPEGGGGAHNNLQPLSVVKKMIKT